MSIEGVFLKILVTGGAGFIGSYLVNKLLDLGHDVVVLDNLSAGSRKGINKRARFVDGSVTNEHDVSQAMKGCNAVFHLAAQTDVRKSMEDPELDHEINYRGSKNVFDAAKAVQAKIIFTSSSAVYGISKKIPISEDSGCNPISEYGKNKLLAERDCPKNAFIVRLFNVYGPGGKGVINIFCKGALSGKSLTVYGDGNQIRDYVSVKDVVDALVLGLKNEGVYNVGTGTETSLNTIIGIISKILNKKLEVNHVQPMKGDIVRSVSDIIRIKRLGWSPKIDINTGIRSTLDSYR